MQFIYQVSSAPAPLISRHSKAAVEDAYLCDSDIDIQIFHSYLLLNQFLVNGLYHRLNLFSGE